MSCEIFSEFPGYSGERPRTDITPEEVEEREKVREAFYKSIATKPSSRSGHAGTIEGALALSQPVDVFVIPSNGHIAPEPLPSAPPHPIAAPQRGK